MINTCISFYALYVTVHGVFSDLAQKWILITVPRTWPGVTFVRPL